MDISEVPPVRALIYTVPICEWSSHTWERFSAQFDFPDRWSEQVVILMLCLVCGHTPLEALGALPIVLVENEYPEAKKTGRVGDGSARVGRVT